MSKSGFRKWWHAQLNDESRNAIRSPPICPCSSCFNGTRSGPANERTRPKRDQTRSLKTPRDSGTFGLTVEVNIYGNEGYHGITNGWMFLTETRKRFL
ncbi:hypothetical protein F4861DRAFT_538080 [Xylaria intraflava]|nr:hypothetical protein F4861DRAFT_538080 [Xylaria intraflava]